MSNMVYKQLNEVSLYGKGRIKSDEVTLLNYISTENMIAEKGGVTTAATIPKSKMQCKYLPNDILLSNIRPYFKKIWFADKTGGCSNDVLVIQPKEIISPKFLYYVLTDNNFFNYSTVTSKGTKMPRGNKHAIMKYLVPDIDLPTQEIIADILSAYDDLIENNNRRIEILEKSAQDLYKEWFVRFRFTNHENTKFENGLPQGWKVKRMNDFCFVTDGTHDTPKSTDNGIPLVTGRCITRGFIDFDSAYTINEIDHHKITKRSGLKSWDILFSNIGTVGNTCLVNYNIEFSVKNVIIFKPLDKTISSYLYYLLTSQTIQDLFANQTNGASQQFVGLTFMRKFKILVPKSEVLKSFSHKVIPILEQKQYLYSQNQNLKKQRDLLLPRLMSCKLEV